MEKFFNINYEFNKHVIHKEIDRCLCEDKPAYIAVADANILQQVANDMMYRQVIDGALFSICDSSWVPVLLKCIYGINRDHYCGSEIFYDIISMKKYRHIFLGTSQEILSKLRTNLSTIDFRISNMQFVELPFCSVEDFDYEHIASLVNQDQTDIIWVALGAPKQEVFMSRLLPFLNRGVMIAVGAAFKFYSGVDERRAPRWIRKLRLEFLYRIISEPRKQIRRCTNIIISLPRIIKEEVRKR